jgi:hypothetical protein
VVQKWIKLVPGWPLWFLQNIKIEVAQGDPLLSQRGQIPRKSLKKILDYLAHALPSHVNSFGILANLHAIAIALWAAGFQMCGG